VANHRLEVADGLIAAGDTAGAAEAYREATEAAPDYTEFSFWQAASLADAGLVDEARQAWEAIDLAGETDRWARALRRTAQAGLLGPGVVRALLDE
jgi:thioredoxin-like negative regulator of GroEL